VSTCRNFNFPAYVAEHALPSGQLFVDPVVPWYLRLMVFAVFCKPDTGDFKSRSTNVFINPSHREFADLVASIIPNGPAEVKRLSNYIGKLFASRRVFSTEKGNIRPGIPPFEV